MSGRDVGAEHRRSASRVANRPRHRKPSKPAEGLQTMCGGRASDVSVGAFLKRAMTTNGFAAAVPEETAGNPGFSKA